MKTKALARCLLFAALLTGSCAGARAADGDQDQSDVDTKKWESPRHDYSIVLTGESDERPLAFFHKGKEIAQYTLPSSLDSIYWSPGGKFVAFNNHYGYRGWYVWIISLKDGSVIRAHGRMHSAKYDRVLDRDSLPDVLAAAKPKIVAVYPGYPKDTDRRGAGHITVTYGWLDDSRLQIYDEVVLDNLADKENAHLSIYSVLNVSEKGLSVGEISVEKTSLTTRAGRPRAVVDALGY